MESIRSAPNQAAPRPLAGAMSLRDLYCEHYGCPPGEFEERMLQQCLHSRLLAGVCRKMRHDFFVGELGLMQRLGQMQNFEDFRHEVESSRRANPPRGLLRRQFKVRVSGHQLLRVAAKLFLKNNLSPRTSSH